MKHLKHFFVVLLLLYSSISIAQNYIVVNGIVYDIINSQKKTVSVASVGNSWNNIVIPETVTDQKRITYTVISIGNSAFKNCTILESIVIPESVVSIGESAFYGCSSLKSIVIPGNVTSICAETFRDCSGLESVIIPGSVSDIAGDAFLYCSGLKYVTFEDGAEELSMGNNNSWWGAFNDSPLDSVYLGRDLSYDNSPFENNVNLRAVRIGDSVSKISGEEFSGCSGLTNVAIGNSLDSIGNSAFYGCNNVAELVCYAKTPPVCDTNALLGINKQNCTLLVPYVSAYKAAEQWKDFLNIQGFIKEIYTVTFVIGGEVYDTLSVEYGEKITLPETPVKEGHTFSGWSGVPETMPAEDITITGSFAVNTYAVTYIVDNEVYATDSIAYGSEIVLRDEPVKEGHTFSGWSEVPETMPAEDITITGSFEVNTYAVTYIVDDEVYATDSVAYGSEIVLRDGPVKEGHTFSGWSEAPETMPAEDITIEGTFSVNSYTITYKVDGEVYATDSIAYGSEIVLRDEPTKEGHTFSGWSEAPETMPAEDITIEGTFSVNSYAITYKVDGEVYATDSIAYGSEIVLRDEPTKEGHTFSGWSDVPETMPANDITIEGTFSINSYTVTFIIDGEVYETATVEFGAEIELPTPPEKEGYIFSGWVGVPDTMPAEDIVIEGEYIVDTTGINDVKAENGNVRTVYDLQGRKVDNPTNGIYIVNGKKVFIK